MACVGVSDARWVRARQRSQRTASSSLVPTCLLVQARRAQYAPLGRRHLPNTLSHWTPNGRVTLITCWRPCLIMTASYPRAANNRYQTHHRGQLRTCRGPADWTLLKVFFLNEEDNAPRCRARHSHHRCQNPLRPKRNTAREYVTVNQRPFPVIA